MKKINPFYLFLAAGVLAVFGGVYIGVLLVSEICFPVMGAGICMFFAGLRADIRHEQRRLNA